MSDALKKILHQENDLTRRSFIARLAGTFLGVGVMSSASALAKTDAATLRRPTAKNVIYLYMEGGMSHLDTFDPKPEMAVAGPVKTIGTRADGVQISEYLPSLAKQMQHVAVVRSLVSSQGAHETGNYIMHCSYARRGTILHPGLGSWLLKFDGKVNSTLPGNIRIGGGSRGVGSGFLAAKYGPLVIGNPKEGLKNSHPHRHISEAEFIRRTELATQFDQAFRARYNHKPVRAYTDMYDDALRLMKSRDLAAFDINQEPKATREAYGNSPFGQGCLLARRLIEHGVRFIEVNQGGWDTHNNNFDEVQDLAANLDQALSTLLADLSRRGMLEETLVVVATEFGRTPTINSNEGRDHHPKAFSCLLAGGGVQGGQVWGATDSVGENVTRGKVTPPDFNATIAYALGLPLETIVYSPSRRPFTVANKGKPMTALF